MFTPYERALYASIYGQPAKEHDLGEAVKAPTTVWRMEIPGGEGIFSSPGRTNALYDKLRALGADRLARKNNERMGITGTGFYRRFGHAHYGCDSPQSLDNWFNIDCRRFVQKELDARIVEYQVRPGQHILPVGHGEVIFNRFAARNLGQYDAVSGLPLV